MDFSLLFTFFSFLLSAILLGYSIGDFYGYKRGISKCREIIRLEVVKHWNKLNDSNKP